ncbi:MAG: flavin reductase [Planctomycetaceae bacterium]|nr:flavin reductase [Planctomycetaceae bacterium]
MKFDAKKQRHIMGKFATGVTVATTVLEGQNWGMTANAITSLSLDPPLMLLAVGRESQSHTMFQGGGCFALNILSAEQEELSNRFASPAPREFEDLRTKVAETGAPILLDALGWLDCKVVDVVAGGDHDIFIGEILDGDHQEEGDPLIYFSGGYRRIAK